MIELFLLKFQSFYSSSFLLKMLVFILFHSASFFIPLIFANFVNCLYFASCKLFTTSWAWSLLFQFEKHVLKESFFQICVSDMQSLGLRSILLERMNSSPSNEIASWCFSSWSHISLPKLILYGCFMPPRQTIYIIHLFGWNFLHRNFIMISLIYFVGIFFFLILFLCKKNIL